MWKMVGKEGRVHYCLQMPSLIGGSSTLRVRELRNEREKGAVGSL